MQPASTGPSHLRAPSLVLGTVLLLASVTGLVLLRPRQRLEDGVEALARSVELARTRARSRGDSVRIEYRLSGGGATPGFRVAGEEWSALPGELVLQALQLGQEARRKGEHAVLVDPQGTVQPHSLVLLQHEGAWDQRTTLHFNATGTLTRESWRRRRGAAAEMDQPAEE